LPKILTSRERWIVRGLIFVILTSTVLLLSSFYFQHTELRPKIGGEYTEGILGHPRYLNPVLAQTNDADRELVQLIYSRLFKYNHQGELIPDLVQDYQIKKDGLVYEISLKKNIFWHDGEPLNADDVIFTIQTIQNPQFKSPLRDNWRSVKVEKVDDYTIRFKLNNVYAPFLHNLTIGILPEHRWAGISAQNFPLAEYNFRPIGSGPYKFKEFTKNKEGQIESIKLIRNDNFYLASPYPIYPGAENTNNGHLQGPFIKEITFRFYTDEDSLLRDYQQRKIDGLSFISATHQSKIRNDFNIYRLKAPEYYAVFFNQTQSKILADKNVRLALAYATDKKKIIEEALAQEGKPVNSPLLADWFGENKDIPKYNFNPQQAQEVLEKAGWVDEDGDGVREKKLSSAEEEKSKLEISLLAPDWPTWKKIAQLLKEQWEKIGIKVNLEFKKTNILLQEHINPREYEALLFGEILMVDPDPFVFWHSSKIREPGLNLALYQNEKVDKLLEEARKTLNQSERMEKYAEFQKILLDELPAIFLCNPFHLYPVNKKVKGIQLEKVPEPSFRFSQIENWYIKTTRVWKKK